MQSGISASAELLEAFTSFTSDTSLFALPITIHSEKLSPLQPIPFTSSSFESSLPSLKSHVQPKTPIYLIVRSAPGSSGTLIAVTYVPSTAPVRSKMLFASTRNTLVRDLGLEKFSDNIFATDDFEVLDLQQWQARNKIAQSKANGTNTDIMTTEERELQSVKRAEEQERHGTSGRDLMGAGGSGNRLAMKITDNAKAALEKLSEEGTVVVLAIDMASETLDLLTLTGTIDGSAFLTGIPAAQPSYAFYRYPQTEETIFIYTCPSASKIRERMTYASAKTGVLNIAQSHGVNVTKRLEASEAMIMLYLLGRAPLNNGVLSTYLIVLSLRRGYSAIDTDRLKVVHRIMRC
ncbi:hypothetical protein BT93_L5514 [Corymbia citriodora subsp. variegata]|uniref:ADF-H domain-containing protein n=1 Tax=Corymbia citriodora subsp. variegata TaxID=360336 RepID=A0A8T0CG21_CORYI|nr:hypothetical protein BT93_L5514 [Corymbia citriodora subsp. variegata]